jgi:small-conductance mechanosensitive channel
MQELLEQNYFGNTVGAYFIALSSIVIAFLVIYFVKRIFVKRLLRNAGEHSSPRLTLFIRGINRRLLPLLYFGAVYITLESLNFSPGIEKIISIAYSIVAVWFGIRFLISILDYFVGNYLIKSRGEEEGKKLRPLLGLLYFLVWVIGFLLLLDNIGFKVTTLIAGLGISGIAVALAAQAILGDLFSYFVIFFDRPFEIGDFIIFDDKRGTIEKIGLKSTRIRSLSGELLIVSNSNLTDSRVHNYKKMERRRVVFNFGVIYKTKPEQLRMIPVLIKEIILKNKLTEYDRGNFQGFGDSSLNFEFVYFVLTSDYAVYMDTQEKINLDILEVFAKNNIEFAYPTQTLVINKES